MRDQSVRELERVAVARLPLAIGLLLGFVAGALPIELYYYPAHRDGYLAVLAVELFLSLTSLLAARRWPLRARAIATAWASLMGLCILGYYPIVAGDATLALAAIICLVTAMPAILPFGLRHQLVLCSICTLGLAALIAWGAPSAVPWPYLIVALLAVSTVSSIGAGSLIAYREEAMRREAVLREAQDSLSLALSRAESAVAMRSRLVANVSHELRTPVNVIIGYADMVLDPEGDPELLPELARRIRDYAVSLDVLISELLDLSRLSCGKVTLSTEPVDLRRLLEDVAQGARLLTRGRPVVAEVRCEVDTTTSDGMRLRQILTNLVTNAVRATSRGSITLVARREADWIVLAVTDTGCGIPPNKQAAIFDAFEQVGGPGSEPGGIGLGLAIVRQIVDLLGGSVSVSSVPGVGSEFVVRLPGGAPPGRPADPSADRLVLDAPGEAVQGLARIGDSAL